MHYGPRVPSEIQLTFPPRKFLRATEYRSISLLSFTPNVLRDREYIQKQVEEAPLSFGKAIIWLNSFVSLSNAYGLYLLCQFTIPLCNAQKERKICLKCFSYQMGTEEPPVLPSTPCTTQLTISLGNLITQFCYLNGTV